MKPTLLDITMSIIIISSYHLLLSVVCSEEFFFVLAWVWHLCNVGPLIPSWEWKLKARNRWMCYLKAHLKNFAGLVPIAVSSQVGSATARSSKLQGSVALRRKGSHLRFGRLVRGRRCVLSAIGNMENAASAAGSSHVRFSLTGVKEWFQIPTSTPTLLRVVQVSSCGSVFEFNGSWQLWVWCSFLAVLSFGTSTGVMITLCDSQDTNKINIHISRATHPKLPNVQVLFHLIKTNFKFKISIFSNR